MFVTARYWLLCWRNCQGILVEAFPSPVRTGRLRKQLIATHINHTGPESCVVHREVQGEALTGETVGQPLSRESYISVQGANAVSVAEGNTDGRDLASARTTCVVLDPGMQRRSLFGKPGDHLDHAKSSVLNSLSSPRSRRNYMFAMEQFIAWYCSEPRLALNRTLVLRFRLHLESLGLAAGTIHQRPAAVRRLTYEAADSGC